MAQVTSFPLNTVLYTRLQPAIDATGNFADLTTYDDERANFTFLSQDGDGDTITDAVYFVKNSATSADWSDPILLRGATGETGSTGATGPGYTATSTTSIAIASSGSKVFTTQAGLAYSVGARVRATDAANTANWMEGVVSAYSGTTLTFTADLSSGSGTIADWKINLAGERGAAGAGDLTSTNNLTDVANAATAFANIKQAATAIATGVVELATDAEAQTGTDTVRAVVPANLTAAVHKQGKHTIWIPAASMVARTTNGAASGSAEMTTNKNMFKTLDFDTTTQEFAQFEIFFPKSWNLGTVTFQPLWSHAATTTNFGVAWGLAGVARSDDDPGDVAFGTAVTSVDTGGTTNDIYIGPESSAITIAGTPAAGDTVQFQINRTVADAGDTMAIDARLHGIRLFFTTNAATDA